MSLRLDRLMDQADDLAMTPLEHAARALCHLDGHPEMATMDGKPLWQDYLPETRAVLAAIREPSQSMREAGAEIIRALCPDHSVTAAEDDAACVWRLMIDAMQNGAPHQ